MARLSVDIPDHLYQSFSQGIPYGLTSALFRAIISALVARLDDEGWTFITEYLNGRAPLEFPPHEEEK